jgi:hypothetical protein
MAGAADALKSSPERAELNLVQAVAARGVFTRVSARRIGAPARVSAKTDRRAALRDALKLG